MRLDTADAAELEKLDEEGGVVFLFDASCFWLLIKLTGWPSLARVISVALAPRGQNTTLMTRLTAVPTAMSPRRMRPVFQPCGSRRLNRTTTKTVNDAWPMT